MKTIFTIITLLLVSFTAMLHAQTPYWQWARNATGGVATNTGVCCTDPSGNIYVAGFFLGTTYFGTDSLTDPNNPYNDVFIAKYNSLGDLLWVRKDNGYSDADGISADANGNVYLVGNFYNDSVSFGGNVLTDTTAGNSNIYLVKYDSLGNVSWTQNLGGTGNDFANGVATDPSGNVYVTGYFTGDSLSLGSIVLHQAGVDNIFLAKLNSSGTALWAHSEGCSGTDGSAAICTDSSGNVFITGYFTSLSMNFGAVTLNSPYMNNLFVTKYDSSGNVSWAKYFGSSYGNASTGLSADASGSVYVTGYYLDTIIIGSDTLAAVGPQSIFTAKYASSGALVWARSMGGSGSDQTNAISTDASGNGYLTGSFQSDTVTFGNTLLINQAGNPITFVAKYDPDGNPLWAIPTTGGTTENIGYGISYRNGNIYVAGAYNGQTIIFGADTLESSIFQGSFLGRIDTSVATGIMPVSISKGLISVYPNPSGGDFYFTGLAAGNTIEIDDMLGKTVFAASVDGESYPVSLAGAAGGVYIYRVKDQGSTVGQGKMVVE